MELRDIEIFLAVADELHFGNAAQRLHLSQARVSQSIKKQERRIGALLFERTSRVVRLTPIGAALRDELRIGYDHIGGSLERARASVHGEQATLRVGVMGMLANELRPLTSQATDLHPGSAVEFGEYHFSDPFGALRSGEVDVQLMWLPVQEPDLVVGPVVLTEGRVLAVAATNDLAERTSVFLEDLAGRSVLDPGPEVPGYWAEAMVPLTTPSGRPVVRGARARTFHEVLALIAADQVVGPLNEHVKRYYAHSGMVCLPIEDAPLTEWALVWHTDRVTPLLRSLVELGTEQGARRIASSSPDPLEPDLS